MPGPHSQDHARVRVEWGPVGAVHTLDAATTAVIVDVLSFTTTLSVAVDIGAEVYPYRWDQPSAPRWPGPEPMYSPPRCAIVRLSPDGWPSDWQPSPRQP